MRAGHGHFHRGGGHVARHAGGAARAGGSFRPDPRSLSRPMPDVPQPRCARGCFTGDIGRAASRTGAEAGGGYAGRQLLAALHQLLARRAGGQAAIEGESCAVHHVGSRLEAKMFPLPQAVYAAKAHLAAINALRAQVSHPSRLREGNGRKPCIIDSTVPQMGTSAGARLARGICGSRFRHGGRVRRSARRRTRRSVVHGRFPRR